MPAFRATGKPDRRQARQVTVLTAPDTCGSVRRKLKMQPDRAQNRLIQLGPVYIDQEVIEALKAEESRSPSLETF